jgi:hypothetical protein
LPDEIVCDGQSAPARLTGGAILANDGRQAMILPYRSAAMGCEARHDSAQAGGANGGVRRVPEA